MGGNGNGQDDAITVEELLARIDGACGTLRRDHPNRVLLEQCRVAIAYLAQHVADDSLRYRSPIIMP